MGAGQGRVEQGAVTRPIVVRPEAGEELVEAHQWYEGQRPGLGDEMVACVEAALQAAARNPGVFQKVHGPVRRVLVRRFPYGVFFFETDSTVVVLAISHAHRTPDYWERRLRDE